MLFCHLQEASHKKPNATSTTQQQNQVEYQFLSWHEALFKAQRALQDHWLSGSSLKLEQYVLKASLLCFRHTPHHKQSAHQWVNWKDKHQAAYAEHFNYRLGILEYEESKDPGEAEAERVDVASYLKLPSRGGGFMSRFCI